MNKNSENKVIIVVLDGACWKIMNKLLNLGKIENMRRIINNGVKGVLLSTIPPISAPAQVSLCTGKNPGKHGIFSFFKKGFFKNEFRIFHSLDNKSPRIWNYLNYYGKSVGIYHLELTYPPENINGFMIPIAPTMDKNFQAVPEKIIQELKEECGEYYSARINSNLSGIKMINKVLNMTKNRANTTLYLLRKYKPNLLLVEFKAPDLLQHNYWGLLSTVNESDYQKDAFKKLLLEPFIEIDNFFGEILNTVVDRNTHIFIISDHGFGPFKYRILVNRILEKKGYLKANKYLMWLLLLGSWFNIGPKEMLEVPASIGGGRKGYIIKRSIDWTKTIACSASASEMGVFLKDKKYADEIRKILLEYRNPLNNEEVFKDVCYREELYNGNYIDLAPDLILIPEKGYVPSDVVVTTNPLFPTPDILPGGEIKGFHEQEGIFIGWGKYLEKGIVAPALNIVDIMPIVLYLMGLPLPDDLDGKVVKDIFKTEFLKDNEITYCKPLELKEKRDFTYTENEKKEIEKRLKGLGYLE